MIACKQHLSQEDLNATLTARNARAFANSMVNAIFKSVKIMKIFTEYKQATTAATAAAILLFMVSGVKADILQINNMDILAENHVYAILSSSSYDTSYPDVKINGENYEVIDVYNDYDGDFSLSSNLRNWATSSGLNAVAYRNKTTDEIVVAFRGTELQPSDIIEDIRLPFGNRQQEQALAWVQELSGRYPTADFSLTGHSLGGGLAQYVSYHTGYDAVTYNAAHVPASIRNEFRSNIISIYNNVDVLGTSAQAENNQIGRIYTISIPLTSPAACWTPFSCHRMKYLLDATVISYAEIYGDGLSFSVGSVGVDESIEVSVQDNTVALSGNFVSDSPLVSHEWRAPDLTTDIQTEITEEAQPVDPPPTATWAGRMSLSGRYTIGLNPATGVVEAMEASGDAPINNFILFNPDAGSISQPLQGVQTTAGIGHSFNHLIWGNWSGGARVWEDNSDQAVGELSGFFVYGELTPATSRTNGSATYTGRLRGDVIEEGGAIHRGLAYGDFGLTANFGTGALGGWFAIAGEDSTDYVFVTDITDARIVRQSDRLAFYGDLGSNYDDASGSIEGYFYGANATELGGTYEVTNTNGEGSSHGILLGWETGTMPDRPADPEDSLAIIVGYDSSANSHGTAWNEGNATGSVISYNDTSDTVESVTKTATFSADGYSYVSWGSWAANDTTRDALGPNGTWVDVSSITPASVIASRTGTAEYSGNIVGGYVSYGGIRDDARGLINITADFNDQSVSGEFQFGHGCGGSGSGPSGCSSVSEVATFDEPINDYGGSGFGNHVGDGLSGVVGVFGGPNGEEIGGSAWLTEDNGQYIGVFRADQ